MGRHVPEKPKEEKPNPIMPLVGFFLLLILGGLSYLVSPTIANWLAMAEVTLGKDFKLLPITFPPEWPSFAPRLVVTLVMFGVFFVVVMILLFLFMKPGGSTSDVTLQQVREEKDRKKKRRR